MVLAFQQIESSVRTKKYLSPITIELEHFESIIDD